MVYAIENMREFISAISSTVYCLTGPLNACSEASLRLNERALSMVLRSLCRRLLDPALIILCIMRMSVSASALYDIGSFLTRLLGMSVSRVLLGLRSSSLHCPYSILRLGENCNENDHMQYQ